MTRMAISPRLAIRILSNTVASQWDVAVFAVGPPGLLALEELEASDQALAGRAREDDVVDVAALGREERVGEGLAVVVGAAGEHGLGVLGFGDLAAVDDLGGALGPEHGD